MSSLLSTTQSRLSQYGVPEKLQALGVPEERALLVATAAGAALLVLSLSLLLCCCYSLVSGKSDGREPLLPSHMTRSDFDALGNRPCRAANNGMGASAAEVAAMCSSKPPGAAYCAAAAPVAMPTGGQGSFFAPDAVPTGGGLGNVGGIIHSIGGSVESAIRAGEAPVDRLQREETKSVTVVVADQEGARGGGWGDLDGFDPSITINRCEHPTARRGAALNQYYDAEAAAGRPRTGTRGGPEGGPPQNRRGVPDRNNGAAAPRGRPGRR